MILDNHPGGVCCSVLLDFCSMASMLVISLLVWLSWRWSPTWIAPSYQMPRSTRKSTTVWQRWAVQLADHINACGTTDTWRMAQRSTCIEPSSLLPSNMIQLWGTYRHHLQLFKKFHQCCLNTTLNIHWNDLVPNIEVLEKAKITSIKVKELNQYNYLWIISIRLEYLKPYNFGQSIRNTWNHRTVCKQMIIINYK